MSIFGTLDIFVTIQFGLTDIPAGTR